jgi:hypothetical protein
MCKNKLALLSMVMFFVGALAFQASAQDDRAVVRTILERLGRNVAQLEDTNVVQFSREGRVIVLNLGRRGLPGDPLQSLPPEIARLTALRSLSLRNLGLTSLPEFIGNMTSLLELNVGDNIDLGTLPGFIGNLHNLRILDVRSTGLSELPFELANLKNLEVLQLWSNNLTALPPFITELTSLKELYLNNNRLASLPTGIERMPTLRYIDTQRNNLCNLPPAVDAWLARLEGRYRDHQWCM